MNTTIESAENASAPLPERRGRGWVPLFLREVRILLKNPVYGFCMVVFPVLVVLFFTSMMNDGQPLDMPVAVVDQDNTSTTRALVQKLDAFQNSEANMD